MYRLTVVYDEPADKEAFDRRYTDEHVPLVKAVPGLVGFQLSHPQGGTPYLVAELFWHSEDAFKAWAATPERADVRNHAEGSGTTFTVYTGDVTEVWPTALVLSRTTDAPINRRRGVQKGTNRWARER